MRKAQHSRLGSGSVARRGGLTDHQSLLIAMQPLLNQARNVLGRMLQRALPYDGYTPAKSPKRLHVSPVAADIAQELPLPELFVGPGCGGVAAAFVSMPEAAVDEHHRPVFREHKVRGAGQRSDMKSIAKSPSEKKGAKGSFRPSILSANARHHAAALRGGRYAHGRWDVPPRCLQNLALRTSPANPSEWTQSADGRWKPSMQLIREPKSRGVS